MLRLRLSRAAAWLLAGAMLLSSASPAWAKHKKEEEAAAPTKSYVLPYAVVALGIALGLIVVCRPARRLDEPQHKETAG